MTQGEVFEWLRGPLLSGAYPSESYTGRELSLIEQQYVLGYYRLAGGVRLRQFRVTNDSCVSRRLLELCSSETTDAIGQTSAPGTSGCLGRFDNLDGTCFDSFVAKSSAAPGLPSSEATEPFVRNGHIYTWRSGLAFLDGLYGWYQSYGQGGYVVNLPPNRSRAVALVAQLEEDEWLDRGSRALEVGMNLYNTNTRMLTVCRIVFEMFPSGHIVKWARIYSVPVLQYSNASDIIRGGFEIIFVGFIIYYLQKAGRRIRRDRAAGINMVKAVLEPNTVFEVLLATLALVMVQQWLRYVTSRDISQFDVNVREYADVFAEAEGFILTLSWAGLVGLCASFRLFQFMSISKRLSTMWLTFKHGLMDLVAFGVSFGLVIVGFALWGEMSFGFFLEDFRTFWASVSALARFTLGAWDYNQLRVARPAFAGVFFTLYSALMTISLLNMIIGIIETSFAEVIDIVETADRWKENSQPAEAACMEQSRVGLSLLCRRSCGVPLMPGDTDIRAERVMMARDRFRAALRDVMRRAKVEGTDLFEHFDTVYDDAGKDDALYISWHELASLLYKSQTFVTSALYFEGQAPAQARSGSPALGTAAAKGPGAKAASAAGAASAAARGGPGATAAAAAGAASADTAAAPLRTGGQPAAGGRKSIEEILAEIKAEVAAQAVTPADAAILFDDDEEDRARAHCGPLFRIWCCCCCTSGHTDVGSLPGLCGSRARSPAAAGGRPARSSSSSSSRASASASTQKAAWRDLRRLMKAYLEFKSVHFVAAARKHKRAKEQQDARAAVPYSVRRFINGRHVKRLLVLDNERGELLNFDHNGHLRKRLPLSQLVAAEQRSGADCSISLVFTSQGVPADLEEKLGGLETVFEVEFTRPTETSRFYEELCDVTSKLHTRMQKLSEIMVMQPAEAAMMLARSGVDGAHGQVKKMRNRAKSTHRLHRGQSVRAVDRVAGATPGARKAVASRQSMARSSSARPSSARASVAHASMRRSTAAVPSRLHSVPASEDSKRVAVPAERVPSPRVRQPRAPSTSEPTKPSIPVPKDFFA